MNAKVLPSGETADLQSPGPVGAWVSWCLCSVVSDTEKMANRSGASGSSSRKVKPSEFGNQAISLPDAAIFRSAPPFREITNSPASEPVRQKAIFFPSGDQAAPAPEVSRCSLS